MKFPIGGIVRERKIRMIWCDSKTDSIVWMKEGGSCKMNSKAKKVALIGMLCAVSYVVLVLVKVPVTWFPTLTLSYEAKDVVIAIGGFVLGPLVSVITSVIVSFIEMVTISSTGFIGFFMNVLSTCAFACTAAIIYKKMNSVVGALIGLVTGIVTATAFMLLWNYIMTPIFMGIPRDAVAGMLIPTFLPFNLLKNGINAFLVFALHTPITYAIRKSRVLESK